MLRDTSADARILVTEHIAARVRPGAVSPTRRAAPSQRLLWAQSTDPPVRGLAEMSPGTSPCRDAAPHRLPFRATSGGVPGVGTVGSSPVRGPGCRTTPTTACRMVHTGSAAVRCPRTRAEIIAAPRPYEPELVRRCSLIGTADSPRARPGTRPPWHLLVIGRAGAHAGCDSEHHD